MYVVLTGEAWMADPSSSKSPTRSYGGPLSPGGGMVLDNTWINTELRKLVFPVSVLGGLLVFVAGLVVGRAEAGRDTARELGITGRSFLWSSQHAQLCLVCLCTASKNSYLEPNCIPVVSSSS